MKKSIYCAIVVCLFSMTHANAQDRPLPPREAAVRMTLPDGFKATLFAGEPDVVQPIACASTIAAGSGSSSACPIRTGSTNPKAGKDRILIFEDTDGDGAFDKRTVFFDKLANLSGIEVGFGGVCRLRHAEPALHPRSRTATTAPPARPRSLLDGWSTSRPAQRLQQPHLGARRLALRLQRHPSPRQGRQARHARRQARRPINCGVWRYHPTREEVRGRRPRHHQPLGPRLRRARRDVHHQLRHRAPLPRRPRRPLTSACTARTSTRTSTA